MKLFWIKEYEIKSVNYVLKSKEINFNAGWFSKEFPIFVRLLSLKFSWL